MAPSTPTVTPDAGAAPAADAVAADGVALQLAVDATTKGPEAMEDFMAPVALYPDPVLAQLFMAVTNPQEVLDAGNWLFANQEVTDKPFETAAEAAGYTVPIYTPFAVYAPPAAVPPAPAAETTTTTTTQTGHSAESMVVSDPCRQVQQGLGAR